MRLVPRGAVLAAALAAGAVAGCGGSVADTDGPDPLRATRAPASPFCAAAQASSEAIGPLNGLVARGDAPPAELAETVDAVRRAGIDLVTVAPDDIRADVELTVQTVNVQLDALIAHDGDAGAAGRDPAVTAALGSPDLTSAGNRYRAYVARNCAATG